MYLELSFLAADLVLIAPRTAAMAFDMVLLHLIHWQAAMAALHRQITLQEQAHLMKRRGRCQ
jgi:hypothetical protein